MVRDRCGRLVWLVAVSILAAAVAAAGPPVQELKAKKPKLHTKDGYTSVVVWRVGVTDPTGGVAGLHPRLVVGPPGSADRVRTGAVVEMSPGEFLNAYAYVTAVEGGWQRSADPARFDGLYVVEARPGSFEWFQLKLDRADSGVGSSLQVFNLAASPCVIPDGRVLYLGRLDLTVADGAAERNTVTASEGDAAADLAAAAALFGPVMSAVGGEPDLRCRLSSDSADAAAPAGAGGPS